MKLETLRNLMNAYYGSTYTLRTEWFWWDVYANNNFLRTSRLKKKGVQLVAFRIFRKVFTTQTERFYLSRLPRLWPILDTGNFILS